VVCMPHAVTAAACKAGRLQCWWYQQRWPGDMLLQSLHVSHMPISAGKGMPHAFLSETRGGGSCVTAATVCVVTVAMGNIDNHLESRASRWDCSLGYPRFEMKLVHCDHDAASC
jgi:hypothetical protein